jgi:hypothetical protein
VCCTLTRLGKKPTEPKSETIRAVVRFGTPDSIGEWNVIFPIDPEAATHVIAAHSGSDNPDYVEAHIPAKVSAGPFSYTDYDFITSTIWAKGRVANPGNPVSCTLTQVNCGTGQYPPSQTPPPPPIQSAQGVFDNPQDLTQWAVAFAPLPNNPFAVGSCYLLESSAASEGTIFVQGTVVQGTVSS